MGEERIKEELSQDTEKLEKALEFRRKLEKLIALKSLQRKLNNPPKEKAYPI